jgi:pimeloyl-ACP methyl ester carboxylesterase
MNKPSKLMIRFFVVAALIGLTGAIILPDAQMKGPVLAHTAIEAARALTPVEPFFEPGPCPFTPAAGLSVDCGFVQVPEDRTRPEGRMIRLAVAIFRSPLPATRPPLIFLGGGPGSFVLADFGPRVSTSLAQDLTSSRDFVMFDQRGVGFSQPSLYCQELVDHKYLQLVSNPSRAQAIEDHVEAAFACRDRLAAAGIDLAAYNTKASAADVNDIRIALAYGAIDVWGLSYGTRLALEVARDFPGAVHSLVLDSAKPPQVNQLVDQAANAERAFRVLFDGCSANPACSAVYPDLEPHFYALVAQLNATPATYFAQNPRTGVVYNVVLTGDGLVRTLNEALVQAFLIPLVPFVIESVRSGDFTLMSQATSLLSFDDSHSTGMFYSVSCADDASRTSLQQVLAARRNVRPEIAHSLYEDSRLRICAGWGASQTLPAAAAPVVSDVPTLILAGEYDPLTPPSYATVAGRTLRSSRSFVFPAVGHNAQRASPCAHSMMMDFLADSTGPDASCIAGMGPPVWFIPGG